MVDLGQVRPVARARWLLGASGQAASFRLEASEDGQVWATVADLGAGTTGYVWQEQAVGRSARYLRWTIANPTNAPKLGGFSEVRLLGD